MEKHKVGALAAALLLVLSGVGSLSVAPGAHATFVSAQQAPPTLSKAATGLPGPVLFRAVASNGKYPLVLQEAIVAVRDAPQGGAPVKGDLPVQWAGPVAVPLPQGGLPSQGEQGAVVSFSQGSGGQVAVASAGPRVLFFQGGLAEQEAGSAVVPPPGTSAVVVTGGAGAVGMFGPGQDSGLQVWVYAAAAQTAPGGQALQNVAASIPRVWEDPSKRRSSIQIYAEIMELTSRGAMSPFELAFYARLNHKRAKDYLRYLEDNGFLQRVEEEGKPLYALTKSGLAFLQGVKRLFVENRIMEVRSFNYRNEF